MGMGLSLQLLLALTAPLRRCTSNKLVILLVWSAFIFSDWRAIFAFGLISNAQLVKTPLSITTSWPSGLLSSTYTWAAQIPLALSPWRTLLSGSAFGGARRAGGGVLLYIPQHAPRQHPRASHGLHFCCRGQQVCGEDQGTLPRELGEFEEVQFPVVDLRSRIFLMSRTYKQTFKLISLELSFMYGVFYTKFLAVSSQWGMYTRTMAFCSSLTALVLFSLTDKGNFNNIDVGVSYTLLVGVILLDMDSAIIRLQFEWVNPVITL
ncbi:hypothetical protein MLD38_005302 [Melastoma candidum]|uniref:Uncharacterized protein n=1 Tax=Melastoma candidum TaxID=119954 RepID=A0ACB9S8U2_9MYRT|nr:hypothetical protein MLD38_005302 [Melastoma candidum]